MTDTMTVDVLKATPLEAWEALKSDKNAVLVDVRTIAEWDYVGLPNLDSIGKEVLKVEWIEFPEMTRISLTNFCHNSVAKPRRLSIFCAVQVCGHSVQ